MAISSFDLVECAIGLGVSRDLIQTGPETAFRPSSAARFDANGCDIVIEEDGGLFAQFNNTALGDVTPTKLRSKRFLDGSDWKLQAYYHDGDDWVTDAACVGVADDQELVANCTCRGWVLRWSDFLDTVGDPHPLAGEYESRVYDAVVCGLHPNLLERGWPFGTDVEFQVAVSEDAEGPWIYGSALTTAAWDDDYQHDRALREFKVSMTSDGSDTPVVNDAR